MSNLRLISATFVAPLASAIAVGVAITTSMSCFVVPAESCLHDPIGAGLLLGVYAGFMVGLPAMLCIGLPMHAGLVRHRRTALIAYLAAGAIAGVLAAFATAMLVIQPPDGAGSRLILFAEGAAAGAFAAAIFWFIRRPDRDAPNPPRSA